MTNLLQVLSRKVSEARIRQKAFEIRNRSADRSPLGTHSRSDEFREPKSITELLFGSQHHRRQDDSDRE
jgi:hypothetical protein